MPIERDQIAGGFISGQSLMGLDVSPIAINNVTGWLDVVSGSNYQSEPPLIRWIGYERNDKGIITRDKKLQYGTRNSSSSEIEWRDVPIHEE